MKYVRLAICLAIISVMLIFSSLGMKTVHDNYVYETYPLEYQDTVQKAAEKYGVDPCLIYGVIKTESNFDPSAQSHVGAVGLMQLMPETFTWLHTYYTDESSEDDTFEDLKDPEHNIDYGVNLLSVLLKMYENEDTAICAYNAGVGNVDSWLEDSRYSRDGKTLLTVPFPETENYRHIVAQNKSCYIKLYREDANIL